MTLAAGFALAACDAPTALDEPVATPLFAAASAATTNLKIPIARLVSIPCAAGGAGEDVLFTGNLHLLFHTTVNGNQFTAMFHRQPQGISGTGLTTGDQYRGTGVAQGTLSGSFVNGQFSDTFVDNFRIIGPGRGNDLLVQQILHITINANGEVTASVANFSLDCK